MCSRYLLDCGEITRLSYRDKAEINPFGCHGFTERSDCRSLWCWAVGWRACGSAASKVSTDGNTEDRRVTIGAHCELCSFPWTYRSANHPQAGQRNTALPLERNAWWSTFTWYSRSPRAGASFQYRLQFAGSQEMQLSSLELWGCDTLPALGCMVLIYPN